MTQDNLIARLRAVPDLTFYDSSAIALEMSKLATEAADLIERLSPPLDPPCTDCGDSGITFQTERRCACQPSRDGPAETIDGVETGNTVAPNFDGEGVIQADRDRVADYWMPPPEDQEDHLPWVRRADAARAGKMDDDALVQAFAAHRRAFTISTPREDEVERVARAIAEELRGFDAPAPRQLKVLDVHRQAAKAALATLTAREQK